MRFYHLFWASFCAIFFSFYCANAALLFSPSRGIFTGPVAVYLNDTTPDPVLGPCIKYLVNSHLSPITDGIQYVAGTPIYVTNNSFIKAVTCSNTLETDVHVHSYIFATINQLLLLNFTETNGVPPGGYPDQWVDYVNGNYVIPGDYRTDAFVVNNPVWHPSLLQSFYDLPITAMTINVTALFNPHDGIYNYADADEPSPYEKPIHFEILYGDGKKTSFGVRCGAQPSGGSGTDQFKNPRFSFRINFKSAWGPSNLEQPLYDRPWLAPHLSSNADKFDILSLDGGMNYVWSYRGTSSPVPQRQKSEYSRDQFSADSIRAMDPKRNVNPLGQRTHLFINGIYWGLYYYHERPDQHFSADYFGGNKDDYDCLKHDVMVPGNLVGSTSNATNYLAMFAAMTNASVPLDQRFLQFRDYWIDLERYLDYYLANLYFANSDWDHHNWYACRHKFLPTARWRYFSWDQEKVMEGSGTGSVNLNLNNPRAPSALFQVFRNQVDFKQAVIDRVYRSWQDPAGYFYVDPLNSACNPYNESQNRPCYFYVKYYADVLNNSVVLESARWGDMGPRPGTADSTYYNWTHFIAEVERIKTQFFPSRTATFLNALAPFGLRTNLSGIYIDVSASPQVTMTALGPSPQPIYYMVNGQDPRALGGGTNPLATLYSGAFTANMSYTSFIYARQRSSTEWGPLQTAIIPTSLLGNLRLTEIMFHPSGNDEAAFLELKNIGTQPVDLSEVNFDGAVRGIIPRGTWLQPGEFFVACENSLEFKARYPAHTCSMQYIGSLSKSGEEIILRDPIDQVVFALNYSDAAPWPLQADGLGYSLVPWFPERLIGWSNGSEWRPSRQLGGSPFADDLNSYSVAIDGNLTTLILSEIHYHPLPFNGIPHQELEFLEFHNYGSLAVDLTGVTIVQGISFAFPVNTTIPPAGFYVLASNASAFNIRYGFAPDAEYADQLSNSGESIQVVAGSGTTLFIVNYSDSAPWPTTPDGLGPSLVRAHRASCPDDPSAPLTWTSSSSIGGNPGAWDAAVMTACPADFAPSPSPSPSQSPTPPPTPTAPSIATPPPSASSVVVPSETPSGPATILPTPASMPSSSVVAISPAPPLKPEVFLALLLASVLAIL